MSLLYIALPAYLIFLGYALYICITKRNLVGNVFILVGILIGIGLNFVDLWITNIYSKTALGWYSLPIFYIGIAASLYLNIVEEKKLHAILIMFAGLLDYIYSLISWDASVFIMLYIIISVPIAVIFLKHRPNGIRKVIDAFSLSVGSIFSALLIQGIFYGISSMVITL